MYVDAILKVNSIKIGTVLEHFFVTLFISYIYVYMYIYMHMQK